MAHIENSREKRLEQINQMIKEIADCGRHFFLGKNGYAKMEVDQRGRVWFIDDYTAKRIYTHHKGRWSGFFSHGGTLKALVECFRDYISKGKKIPCRIFGPFHSTLCNGDLWGYGDDMQHIREKAVAIGLIEGEKTDCSEQTRKLVQQQVKDASSLASIIRRGAHGNTDAKFCQP